MKKISKSLSALLLGLGIRDLCRHDDDLLILAGPTMDLDDPVHVLRWPGGAKKHKKGELIPATGLQRLHEIQPVPHLSARRFAAR